MGERRLRTAQRRKRARARFWIERGDAVRATVIGVFVTGAVSFAAWLVLS